MLADMTRIGGFYMGHIKGGSKAGIMIFAFGNGVFI